MVHVLDLLIEQQIEEDALGLDERVKIVCATETERLDAGEPRRRRTLHHMMADGQGTRRGDDAK